MAGLAGGLARDCTRGVAAWNISATSSKRHPEQSGAEMEDRLRRWSSQAGSTWLVTQVDGVGKVVAITCVGLATARQV